MKNKLFTILFITLILLCSLVGCGNMISVQSITLVKSEIVMEIGEKVTLTATITPDNATDKSLTWSVDDTTIATVSESGEVTALSAGETTLTVKTTSGDKTASCLVKVNDKTYVYETYMITTGEYIYGDLYVGDMADHYPLPKDKFVLTLNPDNTCTLNYRASQQTTVVYSGSYTKDSNRNLVMTVVSSMDNAGTPTTINAKIDEDKVSLSLEEYEIILKDINATRIAPTIDKVIGEYNCLAYHTAPFGGGDTSALLDLKEDGTFTFNYTFNATESNLSGTWTYDNAGNVSLTYNETTNCAIQITVSDGLSLGIWIDTNVYLNLRKIRTFKSISINEVYGLGDIYKETETKWRVFSENSCVLTMSMSPYEPTYKLSLFGSPMEEGTWTKNENVYTLNGHYNLDVVFRKDCVVLNPHGGALFIMVEDVNEVLSDVKVKTGSYNMMGAYKEEIAYTEGYDCDINLNENNTFNLNYTIPNKQVSLSGTWSQAENGKINLSYNQNTDCSTIISVSQHGNLGIWCENNEIYFSLAESFKESIVGTYDMYFYRLGSNGFLLPEDFKNISNTEYKMVVFSNETYKIVITSTTQEGIIKKEHFGTYSFDGERYEFSPIANLIPYPGGYTLEEVNMRGVIIAGDYFFRQVSGQIVDDTSAQSIVGTYFFESVDINGTIYEVGDTFNGDVLTEDYVKFVINENGEYQFLHKKLDDVIVETKSNYSINEDGQYEFSLVNMYTKSYVVNIYNVEVLDGYVILSENIKLKKKSTSTDMSFSNGKENLEIIEKYNFYTMRGDYGVYKSRGDKAIHLTIDGENVEKELNENSCNFIMYENSEALMTVDYGAIKFFVNGSYTVDSTSIVFEPYFETYSTCTMTKDRNFISFYDGSDYLGIGTQTMIKDCEEINDDKVGKYVFYAAINNSTGDILEVGDNDGYMTYDENAFTLTLHKDGGFIVRDVMGTRALGILNNNNDVWVDDYYQNWSEPIGNVNVVDNLIRISIRDATVILRKEYTTVLPGQVPELN